MILPRFDCTCKAGLLVQSIGLGIYLRNSADEQYEEEVVHELTLFPMNYNESFYFTGSEAEHMR